MSALEQRVLRRLSIAALKAVVQGSCQVAYQHSGTPSHCAVASEAAQLLGLTLAAQPTFPDGVTLWDFRFTKQLSCNLALRKYRQASARVSKAVFKRDRELRKQQTLCLADCQVNNSSKLQEARLEYKLLSKSPLSLKGFPYLCNREYASGGGKGDLAFTDGQGMYAVVEVKHINMQSSKSTRKRSIVKKQALKYAQALDVVNPDAFITLAGTYTEEKEEVQWLELPEQNLKGIYCLATALTEGDL